MKIRKFVCASFLMAVLQAGASGKASPVGGVIVNDSFWAPKMQVWNDVTIPDVLNKFEGKHTGDPHSHNAFANFSHVAAGERGTCTHFGAPWFDGLIYETIRGIADYLVMYPDPALEARVDSYIASIAAAQASEPSGYLETYTMLNEPLHRWGDNGGFLRWQHDVYNAGMMVEAAVHYYRATGKTQLLDVAVKCVGHMVDVMGPAPKKNVVPSHSGPEEALVKLYRLFKDEPQLKERMSAEIDEQQYLDLVTFWIENRGHHCGFPHWLSWGNDRSEQWIREAAYNADSFGEHSRPSWGDYAQDSIPVFDQTTIEGHAVRATLLATGIAAVALENRDARYVAAAERLWSNMVGRRMFVTGGVGAIHEDEKFGPDYFLPPGAYLETCAAIGAAFFSENMHRLTRDGKYIDELERVLYNSLLTAVSLGGDNYTYQNPLNADDHNRWEWHGCPCCPPMFLKITSVIPKYIYATHPDGLYVNLFIGSDANLEVGGMPVKMSQRTHYPWSGDVEIEVNPAGERRFAVKVRVPGWARGVENPDGLYRSDLGAGGVSISVNGKKVGCKIVDGYATIDRKWHPGDIITLSLPMQPRVITAHDSASELAGKACVASGPVIYAFESVDNPALDDVVLQSGSTCSLVAQPAMLSGINTIVCGDAVAVPYYAIANRQPHTSHRVWVSRK